MPILSNYKDIFVGYNKDNTERATSTANKSMGLDPKATPSCYGLFTLFVIFINSKLPVVQHSIPGLC